MFPWAKVTQVTYLGFKQYCPCRYYVSLYNTFQFLCYMSYGLLIWKDVTCNEVTSRQLLLDLGLLGRQKAICFHNCDTTKKENTSTQMLLSLKQVMAFNTASFQSTSNLSAQVKGKQVIICSPFQKAIRIDNRYSFLRHHWMR